MRFSTAHDYHIHSHLSLCSNDPGQTAQTIYDFARRQGYDSLCLTDHLWDGSVPGASEFYTPQDYAHVSQSLPLPKGDIPFYFGCETEFCGGRKLGLAREHFDLFDFVIIPVTHMHMTGFVRPVEVVTQRQMADLIPQRLEELLLLDLPWRKTGLAHLTDLAYPDCDREALLLMMDEGRMMRVFDQCAERGIGIELNAYCFTRWKEQPDVWLRLYRMAKKAGCLFYCGSDAHERAAMDKGTNIWPEVAEALELTESDRYRIGRGSGVDR